ncbi:thioredoxin domain-containing protein [Chamaesiphon sp. OTE_75_metabat_556]|uniref:thioredoxin domain-containing protein n=1 Tax=Chamaesiphon sp. OTE_75_metabat_556 TaxID=2964692 RepID=UPI00286CCE7D|nr:thioredoxin domain-containing protein [Chamaesiphon sp. OTE_75_metabat_556]
MKLKYLAVLAAISLLSLTTACSTPSATAPSNNVAGESKVDPCAGKKVDPCAGKKLSAASVGGPLAKKIQGKPVVVDVYASWCPACKNIAPTVAQLKQKYADKVEFVVLDVSDKSTTATAEARAKELGLGKFLTENKTQTGSLMIVDPATRNILAQHRNNPDLMAYTKVLDAAITK